MTRKLVLVLFCSLLVIALVLAGCSSTPSSTTPAAPTLPRQQQAPVHHPHPQRHPMT